MTITPDTFVADVATQNPASIRVFQRYGIDFCCGGRRPLREASQTAGISIDRLLGDLQTAGPVAPGGDDWNVAPLAQVVRHISETYHAPLEGELLRIDAMLTKVEHAHADRWPDLLLSLGRVVRTLAQELTEHTEEEEDRLFPAILALEERQHVALHGRALDRFIEQLEDEHVSVGRLLERLRALTNAFAAPEGACPTFKGLYHALEEFSTTLKRHVHLENYVLFPRAAALGRARADAVEEV